MPQIRRASLAAIVFCCALYLGGCGDSNPQVSFAPETGHPAGWSAAHAAAGRSAAESCFHCHGDNLDGGISRVSCTSCHLGGAATAHPLQWGSYAYARHGAYAASNGSGSCALAACHGETLQGGTGGGPDCAQSCHLGGADRKHPADWTSISSHKTYVSVNGSASCKTAVCHGADGKGVFLSGPSCELCHSMK